MSSEYAGTKHFPGPDAFPEMMLRRSLSGIADVPVDFYMEGLKKAQQYAELTKGDVILDIGASNGQFIIEAAQATNVPSYLIGLDIDDEAYRLHMPPDIDQSRFSFIKAPAERNPLPDNSVKVATAHNVIFRAADPYKMLAETKRVVEPDGLIIISTNGRYHAFWRHCFERLVATFTSQATNMWMSPLNPPAEGCYLEDMPHIIACAKGLTVLDNSVVQACCAKITENKVDDFIQSISSTVNRSGLPPETYEIWRSITERIVRRFVMGHMIRHEGQSPYFCEKIHRGMFVLRNTKH